MSKVTIVLTKKQAVALHDLLVTKTKISFITIAKIREAIINSA